MQGRSIRAKCTTSDGVSYSNYYDVEYGTPQGSCLGPLLFLIFTNDLHLNLLYRSCILFADDTTLFVTHKNMVYMEWCMQEDLKILQDWFKANKLTLNINKSVAMHFSNKKERNIKINVGEVPLPVATKTKFLGVWIDSSLSWNIHFDELILKLAKGQYLLKCCKNIFSMQTKVNIYYAHVYSHLVYGITIWGNMLPKEKLKKLQKLQNCCVRAIAGKEFNANTYKQLNLLTVEQIIRLYNLKMGYKVQHSQLPEPILIACKTDAQNKSLKKDHQYLTRHKHEINRVKAHSKWYSNSFMVQSTKEFQNLPDSIKSIKFFPSFVKTCKQQLLNTTLVTGCTDN